MITFTRIAQEINTPQSTPLEIELPFDERKKSRLKTKSRCGKELGLILPRGHILRNGTLLQSESGDTGVVFAAPEKVSTARAHDATLLSKAAYHLGNRHVALQVENGWLRYQHDHVLDEMVKGLGLSVNIEMAEFEPEDGAYANGGHHHDH